MKEGNLVLEPLENEITISNGELLVDTNINKSDMERRIILNIQSLEVIIIKSILRSMLIY